MTEIEFEKYARKGAYHWDEYFGGLRRINAYTKARYDVVVQCLRDAGIGRGAHVLDVGCGDGALAGVLAVRLGCQLSGVDTSPLAIDYAAAKFAERGHVGDFRLIEGYRYDVEDGAFDAVVCSDVIEHVREPESILREICRVLRPAGVLVLTTPIRFTERPLDAMHVQEWFVDEFVDFCGEAFGAPERVLKTHPVFWYEAYARAGSIAGRLGRLTINALTMLGLNPFLRFAGGWRCYTTQVLVLRKPAAPEAGA